jgi:pimeloyl-ACP methyl ester carboxylesterase
MGGFVACELAIRFPARVQRLVLVRDAASSSG